MSKLSVGVQSVYSKYLHMYPFNNDLLWHNFW